MIMSSFSRCVDLVHRFLIVLFTLLLFCSNKVSQSECEALKLQILSGFVYSSVPAAKKLAHFTITTNELMSFIKPVSMKICLA